MTTLDKLELTKPTFAWMPEHQVASGTLKIALTTAVFGYVSFNREFISETDASLKGLGAVLS